MGLAVVACSAAPGGGGQTALSGESSGTTGQSTQAAACPATPNGVVVGLGKGQQLPAHIKVKACDGSDFDLDMFCGAPATWLYLVHMWCPHVKHVSTYAEQLAESFASEHVASIHVIVEGPHRQPPTSDDCNAWAATYGYGPESRVKLYYDPTGAMKALMDSEYTSQSAFVDAKRVIVSKSHTDQEDELRSDIQSLLSSH